MGPAANSPWGWTQPGAGGCREPQLDPSGRHEGGDRARGRGSATWRGLTENRRVVLGEDLVLGPVGEHIDEVTEVPEAVGQGADGEVPGGERHQVPEHPLRWKRRARSTLRPRASSHCGCDWEIPRDSRGLCPSPGHTWAQNAGSQKQDEAGSVGSLGSAGLIPSTGESSGKHHRVAAFRTVPGRSPWLNQVQPSASSRCEPVTRAGCSPGSHRLPYSLQSQAKLLHVQPWPCQCPAKTGGAKAAAPAPGEQDGQVPG